MILMRIIHYLLLAFALLMISLQGCVKQGSERPIEIIYTGNLIGTVGPCKCPGNPAGGIPRLVYQMNASGGPISNRILVDCGNYSSMRSDIGQAKTELVLTGLVEAGVHAVSPGYRDLRYGIDFLRRISEERHVPFVASNLVETATDQSPFPGSRVIRVGAVGMNSGYKVGFIGVMKQRQVVEEFGAHLLDPVLAIRREINRLPSDLDLTVLLTDADQPTIASWLDQVGPQKIDAVISSDGTNRTTRGRVMDNTLFYRGNRQGRSLQRLMFSKTRAGWNVSKITIPLNPDVPSDPQVLAHLRRAAHSLDLTDRQVNLYE